MSQFPTKDLLAGNFISEYAKRLNKALTSLNPDRFEEIQNLLTNAIQERRTIFVGGNGGSASISEHFTCDFAKGVSTNTEYRPKMWSLSSNVALMSAISNDISYDETFSTQLNLYGQQNDLLVLISSSGNSNNIIRAIEVAKNMNMTTIGIFGFSGGRASALVNLSLHIDCDNYGIVEDVSQIIMHMLAQRIRLSGLAEKDIEQTVF